MSIDTTVSLRLHNPDPIIRPSDKLTLRFCIHNNITNVTNSLAVKRDGLIEQFQVKFTNFFSNCILKRKIWVPYTGEIDGSKKKVYLNISSAFKRAGLTEENIEMLSGSDVVGDKDSSLLEKLKSSQKDALLGQTPIHISKTKDHETASYHITPSGDIYRKIKGAGESGHTKTFKKAHRVICDLGDCIPGTGEVARLVSHKKLREPDLKHEYDLLKKLKGKRGVIEILDIIVIPNKYNQYTFTTYTKLYNLGDFQTLKIKKNYAKNQIIDDLVEGLCAIHKIGVAHRDIKLENILVHKLGNSYEAAICDFDLALEINSKKLHQNAGTLPWFAPEKMRAMTTRTPFKKEHELKADIWALGLVFYIKFMNELAPPWFYSDHSDLQVKMVLSNKANNDGSFFDEPKNKDSFDHLVWRMLQCNPNKRPDMNELRKCWKEIRKNQAQPASQRTPHP